MNRFDPPNESRAVPTDRFGNYEVEEFTLRSDDGVAIGVLYRVTIDYEWDATNEQFVPIHISYCTDPDYTTCSSQALHPGDSGPFVKSILAGWRFGKWSEHVSRFHEFTCIY